MKTLVIFNSHIVNDETIYRFRKIRFDIADRNDYDIKWCIDTTSNKNVIFPQDINPVFFDINDVKKIKHIYFDSFKLCSQKTNKEFMWLNGNNYLMLEKNIVSDYDYVWMIEFDACYAGNWNTFFTEMEQHTEDLLSYNIEDIKNAPDWSWSKYIAESRSGKLPFYKHLGCVCRMSKKCILETDKFLQEYNIENNYYYELIWPTSVIRNGLTYFNIDNYCQKPFWPGYAPIHDIQNGKLYHAVKDFTKWRY